MTTDGKGKVWTGGGAWWDVDVGVGQQRNHAEALAHPRNTLSDVEARPWLYWSPLVRERVAKFLDTNRRHWKEVADEEDAGRFPISTQHFRDEERAFSDLLRLIGYPERITHPGAGTGVESARDSWDANGSAVGMGEEPAP